MTDVSFFPIEAALVCPKCDEAKFIVRRKPTNDAGAFEHVLQGLTQQPRNHKYCDDCGCALERGPLPEPQEEEV